MPEPLTDQPVLPPGGHWTDIPALVDQQVATIQARVDAAQGGSWYLTPEPGLPEGTVRTRIDGYQRMIGQLVRVREADRDLILYAHDDLTWLLSEHARLRAALEHARAAALNEGAAALDRIAEQAEAKVLAHYGGQVGHGSCDMVREAARTLRDMAPACSCAAEPVRQAGCDAP